MKSEIQLRRDRDTLIVSGAGVILFGAWSIVKAIMTCSIGRDSEYLREIFSEDGVFGLIIFFLMVLAIVAVDLKLRLFVGRSARAEGFGTQSGKRYFWAALILIAGSVLGVAADFFTEDGQDILDIAASVLTDATSAVITIQLMAAAIRVRRAAGYALSDDPSGQQETGERKMRQREMR